MRTPALATGTLLVLTLISCGKDKSTIAECKGIRTPIERFSVCLPEGWVQVTQPFGEQGNIVITIQPPENGAPSMRMHVKKDPLLEPVRSHLEFAEQAVEFARKNAPDYSAVRTDPLTISNRDSLLHIFDAKPDPAGDPVRYYQFVTVNESIAYGFTAVIEEGVDEALQKALIEIFTSVEFV